MTDVIANCWGVVRASGRSAEDDDDDDEISSSDAGQVERALIHT
jgi:hypothetical protein